MSSPDAIVRVRLIGTGGLLRDALRWCLDRAPAVQLVERGEDVTVVIGDDGGDDAARPPTSPPPTMRHRTIVIGRARSDREASASGVTFITDGSSLQELLQVLREHDRREPTDAVLLGRELSEREVAVLRLVREGRNVKEVARQLGIALTTCRDHLKHARTKLDCQTTLQAVVTAEERRLLEG